MKKNCAKVLYIFAILGTSIMICGSDAKESSGQDKDQDIFKESKEVQKQVLQSQLMQLSMLTKNLH